MDFLWVLYTVQKMAGLKLSSGTPPRDVSSRQGQLYVLCWGLWVERAQAWAWARPPCQGTTRQRRPSEDSSREPTDVSQQRPGMQTLPYESQTVWRSYGNPERGDCLSLWTAQQGAAPMHSAPPPACPLNRPSHWMSVSESVCRLPSHPLCWTAGGRGEGLGMECKVSIF